MGEPREADENSGSLSEGRGVEVAAAGGRGGERRDFPAVTEPPSRLSVHHIPHFLLCRSLQSTLLLMKNPGYLF